MCGDFARILSFVCCGRAPFQEDEWVRGVLSFGEGDDFARCRRHDARRTLLDGEPRSRDSQVRAPEVMKAVVRANQNNGGSLRHGHSRGSRGGRTDCISACGGTGKGRWVIEGRKKSDSMPGMPQRLKARLRSHSYGAAKAVPLQSGARAGTSSGTLPTAAAGLRRLRPCHSWWR